LIFSNRHMLSIVAAELEGKDIIIPREDHASQVYNRGYHGQPQPGGSLKLELIEALFLLESGKIEITENGGNVPKERLISLGLKHNPHFEIDYLVYTDIRSRGYVAKSSPPPASFRVLPRGGVPGKTPSKYWVIALSERSQFKLSDILNKMEKVQQAGKEILFGIVDEESDLTYYSAHLRAPKGVFKSMGEMDLKAYFLGDRTSVLDKNMGDMLHDSEFYGKWIGSALQLSLIETAYLMEEHGLVLLDAKTSKNMRKSTFIKKAKALQANFDHRLSIYSDLKSRGLIVKTGFKYGTHFRAYENDPDSCHARYLVHAIDPEFQGTWPELSRAIRLAHGVRKDILFGISGKQKRYLQFKRYRP